MRIAFLVDSVSNLKEDKNSHLYVLPLYIIEIIAEHQETFKSGFNIDLKTLTDKMINAPKGVKFSTSQTSEEEVRDKVKSIINDYDLIIGIPIDKEISTSYLNWKIVEKEFEDKFHVLDSRIVEVLIAWLISDIKVWLKNNQYSRAGLDEFVYNFRNKCGAILFVTDTKPLVAGGRLSNLKSFIIKSFKFHLLISFLGETGKLQFFNKAQSASSAHKLAVQFLEKKLLKKEVNFRRAALLTTMFETDKNQLIKQEFVTLLNNAVDVSEHLLSPVICTHTGINSYAFLIQTE